MYESIVHSPYALIGDNLDLMKNVSIEIDNEGKITNISHEDPEENLHSLKTDQSTLMIPGLINSHVHIGDSFAKELGFNRELSEIVAPPFGLKHKLLRQAPEEVIITGIEKAILEMLSNGITCFIDFREGGVEGVLNARMNVDEALVCSSVKGELRAAHSSAMWSRDICAVFVVLLGAGVVARGKKRHCLMLQDRRPGPVEGDKAVVGGEHHPDQANVIEAILGLDFGRD